MKKQKFNFDKWFLENYEKVLVIFVILIGLYVFLVEKAEAKEAYWGKQDIFQSEFVMPVNRNEFNGIKDFKMEEVSFWKPAPHAWEHNYKVKEVEATPSSILVEGKSSWYSWEGCLGCDPNRIMANGEPLDDTALTLAVTPELMSEYKLLNDLVLVTNLENGRTIQAKITDTGGFSKYDRVADLSVATSQMLECYNCKVRIEKIN